MIKMGEAYADDGVAIMEILLFARLPEEIQEYVLEYDYLAVRTLPRLLMQEDYEVTEIFLGCGQTTLIDLNNMRVIESVCGMTMQDAEDCIQKHL